MPSTRLPPPPPEWPEVRRVRGCRRATRGPVVLRPQEVRGNLLNSPCGLSGTLRGPLGHLTAPALTAKVADKTLARAFTTTKP